MNKIYRYYEYFGRMGDLEGVFVATEEQIKNADNYVSFGEVLGKHSDIESYTWKDYLTVLTDDQEFIAKALAYGLCGTGYNPLEYIVDFSEED